MHDFIAELDAPFNVQCCPEAPTAAWNPFRVPNIWLVVSGRCKLGQLDRESLERRDDYRGTVHVMKSLWTLHINILIVYHRWSVVLNMRMNLIIIIGINLINS